MLGEVQASLADEELQSLTVTALVAEMLLDRGRVPPARSLLTAALARFPDDMRLQQLVGLSFSWNNEPQQAIEVLEPLLSRKDDETAGITAGAYKRMWQANRHQFQWLEKANEVYRGSWKRCKKVNAYLGINAASTALLLARPADARQLAAEVRGVLEHRRERMHRLGEAGLRFDYWDQVTLAEALLLVGELAAAHRAYHEAFAEHADRAKNVDVTRTQLKNLLQQLGIDADTWIEKPVPVAAQPSVRVGVTGHRSLPDSAALRSSIAAAIARIRDSQLAAGRHALTVVTALAEGADRFVARAVLASEPPGCVEVVLPLEIDDYATDFKSTESRREFHELLGLAERVQFPPPPRARGKWPNPEAVDADDARNAGYERGGRTVVDTCDVLLAIWDGQPARGRGGTAEIIDYARAAGKPIVWIQSAAPDDLTVERLPASG